jgi:hypothetical protein
MRNRHQVTAGGGERVPVMRIGCAGAVRFGWCLDAGMTDHRDLPPGREFGVRTGVEYRGCPADGPPTRIRW